MGTPCGSVCSLVHVFGETGLEVAWTNADVNAINQSNEQPARFRWCTSRLTPTLAPRTDGEINTADTRGPWRFGACGFNLVPLPCGYGYDSTWAPPKEVCQIFPSLGLYIWVLVSDPSNSWGLAIRDGQSHPNLRTSFDRTKDTEYWYLAHLCWTVLVCVEEEPDTTWAAMRRVQQGILNGGVLEKTTHCGYPRSIGRLKRCLTKKTSTWKTLKNIEQQRQSKTLA